MTSQMSMSMRSNTNFSSLTKAMLTARKMFSVILTASAVSSVDTGTARDTTAEYSISAARAAAGPSPATTLGIVLVRYSRLPGSSRSGE